MLFCGRFLLSRFYLSAILKIYSECSQKSLTDSTATIHTQTYNHLLFGMWHYSLSLLLLPSSSSSSSESFALISTSIRNVLICVICSLHYLYPSIYVFYLFEIYLLAITTFYCASKSVFFDVCSLAKAKLLQISAFSILMCVCAPLTSQNSFNCFYWHSNQLL